MKNTIIGGALFVVVLLLAWSGWRYFTSMMPGDESYSLEENADYFDTLRYVRSRLRENPDHLPARYAAIVKDGSPEDLVVFLRDRFEVVPPPEGWLSASWYFNTGTYGALHGGVATPRELAELLADGLRSMGYETELVQVSSTVPPRTMKRKPFEKASFLQIDWENIRRRVGGKPLPALPPEIDTTGLWQRVKAAIPENFIDYSGYPEHHSTYLPTVRFRKKAGENPQQKELADQEWFIADLWNEGKAFLPLDQKWTSIGTHGGTGKIQLRLLVKTTNRPGISEVLKASFTEDMVAGAAIRMGFVPLLGDPQAVLTTKPNQISRFQSYIKVEGGNPDMPDDKRKIFGKIVSSRGEIGHMDKDTLVMGDKRLANGGDPARVRALRIGNVSTSRYPWIDLFFDPLDAQGNVVAALPQSAFRATLEGQDVFLNLVSNTRVQPKIIFLIDGSTSVAPEYRADKLKAVILGMAHEIQNAYPGARFKVMGDSPDEITRGWSDDAEFIANEASSIHGTTNNMWRSVIEAGRKGADAIIYFTDGNDVDAEIHGKIPKPGEGVGYEELPKDYKLALARAPVTFTLGGERLPDYPLGPAFEGIPKATGGEAFQVVDHEEAIHAVIQGLGKHLGVYRGYVKSGKDLAGKIVTLSLSINGIEEKRKIRIPEPKWRHNAHSVQGLYVAISRPGFPETVHRLAGAPYGSYGNGGASVSATDEKNARLGLFGQYTLIAQAGTPSASQILDSLISERLSYEKVIRAGSSGEMLKAMAQVAPLPRTLFTYVEPLTGAHDKGLRYWIDARQRVILNGQEKLLSRTDILPLSLYSTAPDKQSGFDAVFAGSKTLNDREARLHRTDFSCLDGTLALRHGYELERERQAQFKRILGDSRYYHPAIIPDTGEIRCLIDLNKYSGAVMFYTDFGGAGLTVEEINTTFDNVDNLLSSAQNLGGNIAAWASFEQTKMKWLRMATIMIATMKPPNLEEMIKNEVCERVSGAVDGVVEGGIGLIGGLVEKAWGLIGHINEIGGALGFGGIETSVPVPGCD